MVGSDIDQYINRIVVIKSVSGLQFTSDINTQVHTMRKEMVLTADDEITDSSLLITSSIWMADENRRVASNEAVFRDT